MENNLNVKFSARKLAFKDVFAVAKIIKKANLKSDFAEFILEKQAENTIDAQKVGIEAVFMLIEKVPDVEDEVYEFFALLLNCSGAEVSELSISELAELVKSIVEKNDLKSFFTSVLVSAKGK